MAIPSDRNTSIKVAEKLSKYKDLEIEITKMWGLKTITVLVVIGALGVVKKDIEKHIDKICLLYTSPSPRDLSTSRMPSSA